MPVTAKKVPLAKKQIPTLLGLGILIISLVAGVLLFSDGTGVFAPRATPETTPKNVKISNLTDKSFTISFATDEVTSGFVKYGAEQGSLKSQASDDRDQLSGSIGENRLHHVTVRGLTPNTAYFFTIGTGSSSKFDNNGAPFTVRTLPTPAGSSPINKTIYGTVITESGAPAEGSVVYVQGDNVGEMSSLVKSSGSWAIALANARTSDGTDFAQLTDDTVLNIIIQGSDSVKNSIFSIPINEAQPVVELTLGEVPPTKTKELTDTTGTINADNNTPGGLTDLLENVANEEETATLVEDTEQKTLDLSQTTEEDRPTVTIDPIIKGTAAPGVAVTIEVNSETQITQTLIADENGDFSLDLASLGQQLEPGEHSVTYTYTDPTTGQPVTRTQIFLVTDTSNQLALADTSSDTTFGSGDPFPVETTPTPTPATSSPTPDTTRSAVVSTDEGNFTAGSVENTIVLIVGGMFFIFAGVWSWWLAHEVRED
ncbi:MAG: fibronectin type III domain-containing protein [Candidatus Paceibacterota bacterium]